MNYLCRFLCVSLAALLFGCGPSEESILTDVSGVWSEDSSSFVEVRLNSGEPYFAIGSLRFPDSKAVMTVSSTSVDLEREEVKIAATREGSPANLSLRKLYQDDGGFILLFKFEESGAAGNLYFVRDEL